VKSLGVFLAFSIIISSSVFYIRQYDSETSKYQLVESQRVFSLREKIRNLTNLVVSDLMIAKGYRELYLYLEAEDNKVSLDEIENKKRDLEVELSTLSKSRRIYDQIRFIDLEGNEVIRVNYRGGLTYLTDQDKLQNKADRYYFNESIKLSEDEIYISRLDLNVENGQVEEPFKPIIRIATPIFINGEKRGVLIFNYLAEILLDSLDDNIGLEGEKVFLINKDGYWLKGPDLNDEWGFVFGDSSKTIYNWNEDFISGKIDLSSHQSMGEFGLYTIISVNSFDLFNRQDDRVISNNIEVIIKPHQLTEKLQIITFIPKETIHSETNRLIFYLFTLDAITLFLLFLASYILIYSIKNKDIFEQRIFKLNEVLKTITKVLRHDLSNAFTHINFSIELFKESKDENFLGEISKSTKQGISVIEEMKELETMVDQDDSLVRISLRDVFEKVKSNHSITINVDGLDNDVYVKADQGIYSVFENIISNAIRHAKAKKVDIKILNQKDNVLLKFIDYGKGIPDSVKDRVFDEGFKYGDTGNSGLGLYIVRQTISRYGGKISVVDNNPKGTIFVIELNK